MSVAHNSHTADHHGHDHGHHDHGSFKSYTIGFVLSVILTAIPFALVMGKVFDSSSTAGIVLLGLAAVQVVVHMIYFLHMNSKAEGGWSMLALIFTGMLLIIMMSGSIWVMYHMNHNMMPGMIERAAQEVQPESLVDTPTTPPMPASMTEPSVQSPTQTQPQRASDKN